MWHYSHYLWHYCVFFLMKGKGPGHAPEKDVPQVKAPEKPKVKLHSISNVHISFAKFYLTGIFWCLYRTPMWCTREFWGKKDLWITNLMSVYCKNVTSCHRYNVTNTRDDYPFNCCLILFFKISWEERKRNIKLMKKFIL